MPHRARTLAWEHTVNILRSVTRRGFNLGTAGWFTVLKPNTWFPASHLRGPHPRNRSITTVATALPAHSAHRAVLAPARAPKVQILDLNHNDHRLLQPVLAVLAALVITSLLLLWIIRPR